jgi:hypothetical protein
VVGINWPHREGVGLDRLHIMVAEGGEVQEGLGVVLGLDRDVRSGDIDTISLMVLAETEEAGRLCWCAVPGEAFGARVGDPAQLDAGVEVQRLPDPDDIGNAACYRFHREGWGSLEGKRLRVLLNGDLVQDDKGRGVDGNHLPPWVPKRPSGDGLEGGTFESWFEVKG